jgi:hypothetical protein
MSAKRTVQVEVTNDFEKVLDVPYYSQFTEIETAGLEDIWQRRSCSILCLKMVMDYWGNRRGLEVPDLATLLEVAQEQDAYDKRVGGWKQDGIVRTAEHFGFTAWRRKWKFSKSEQELFRSWGWSDQGIKAAAGQTGREGIMTLTNAIVADVPVMVSVPKQFNPAVNKLHLVVLTGIKKDALLGVYRGFYVNDPYNPKRSGERPELKDDFVTQEQFIKHWLQRAIFVVPRGIKL